MRVCSFIRQGHDLRPIDIELKVVPGLPQIIFLGLPDAALKESALRIRTALRAEGFKLPQARQIVVQLKPSQLKKSSSGLDLAVAAAFLWATKQIPRPKTKPILYGELSLGGEVETPDDVDRIQSEAPIYVGSSRGESLPFPSMHLRRLKDLLSEPSVTTPKPVEQKISQARALTFAPEAAELAMIVAAGEHPALLAGPAGTGKTTLMDSVEAWLERAPRPFAKPHHTIPMRSMIGGGNHKVFSGEITRAHGGILLMDEFLKFAPEIQDALREPVETGCITIARQGQVRELASRFLLLATTNLCDCGAFVPGDTDPSCRCRLTDVRRFFGRLRGPFLDRFALISFSNRWTSDTSISSAKIAESVREAVAFRRESRGQTVPNSVLSRDEIESRLSTFQRTCLDSALKGASLRRRIAVLQVTRTLADLRCADEVGSADLEKALQYAYDGHRLLQVGV